MVNDRRKTIIRDLLRLGAGFYFGLTLLSLLAVFGFDFYEPKFGGRWENVLLNAVFVFPPCLVAVTSGYLATVLGIGAKFELKGTLLQPFSAALVAVGLALAPHILPGVLPGTGEGRGALLALYWLVVGVLVGGVNLCPVSVGARGGV